MNINNKKRTIKLSEIPLKGSLGLLAVGDVAFAEWRKVKQAHNMETKNRKE